MTLREDLIAVAMELLDEGGPENVAMREVGRRAGVSRTAPYLHFQSKMDLLNTVAAKALRELVHAVEELRREGSATEDVLRQALLQYAAMARDRPERFRLVFGYWRDESDELIDAATEANALLVDLVAHCQDEGTLPAGDPWFLAATIRSFVHGVAVLDQAGHLFDRERQPLDPRELIEAVLQPGRPSPLTSSIQRAARRDAAGIS